MQEYRKAGCSKHGVCEHKVVVVCEKCTAEKCGTQSTDTQQLKAKIASFAEILDISKDGHFTKDFIVAKLRQLSAVNNASHKIPNRRGFCNWYHSEFKRLPSEASKIYSHLFGPSDMA